MIKKGKYRMDQINTSRRNFILLGAAACATSLLPVKAFSFAVPSKPRFTDRKISLYNAHTKESFEGIYWREGYYQEAALQQLAHLLRDRRNNHSCPIDPELFNLLHRLASTLELKDAYHVICGYRSPETNKMLHTKSTKVAKNSLHMKGRAVDIRLSSVKLKDLRNAATSLKAGGVGYYPKSNFIHVDIRSKPTYWS